MTQLVERDAIHLSFIASAREGNVSDMERLLFLGADIDHVDNGASVLITAAKQGDSKVAKFLIDKGADLNLRALSGRSALMAAVIFSKSVEVIKLLLEHGAKPDQTDDKGMNALAFACKLYLGNKNEECIVNLLLKHGAQVNFQNEAGTSPLLFASKNYRHSICSIVTILFKNRAEVDLQDKRGKSALMFASESQNIDLAKQLLKRGAKVDMKDHDGGTALMLAIIFGSIVSVKLLVKHGANVNLQDNKGVSALEHAVVRGEKELIELLLKHGAQVNMQNNDGRSALTFATTNTIVDLLLGHGAQVDLQDNDGHSALMHVCKNGSITAERQTVNAARELLEGGAQVNLQNINGQSALMFATRTARADCVKLLLNYNAEVNLQDKDGVSSLMISVNAGVRVLRALLEGGAQINLLDGRGRSALMFAKEESIVTVRTLIGYGASVNLQDEDGRSCLMLAFAKGYREIAEILLHSGMQVNIQDSIGGSAIMNLANFVNDDLWLVDVNLLDKECKSALMLACQNNVIHDVSVLLSRGAEVNQQDKEGWSALMRAAAGISSGVLKVKQLVENQAALNLRNSEGLTALMIASLNGNTEALEALLQGGASVDSSDNDGKSALIHAGRNGDIDTARRLLEYGAYIDWQDNEGFTPLMAACCKGHKELASFLIDFGASVYLKNKNGKTAYEFALEKNYADILELFTKLRTNSSFPGILFSENVKKERLTSTAMDITLEDVGISLSIPEDALPSTDAPLEVQILPCFSGSWEVPENLELVSPAYIVEPSREVVFRKEVLVKIWHHANLETEEDCEDMVFLSASTTPEYRGGRPFYVFEEITGTKGSFRPREEQPAGEIALTHFCILGIFRRIIKRKLKGHLYSARFYTAREKKAVIFCMCVFQPHYIRSCDRAITTLHMTGREPTVTVKDGVMITAKEVCVKPKCPGEWKTFCKTQPASILKDAVGIQAKYGPGDCNLSGCLPQIEIAITSVPESQDSDPLELRVEGLNVESVFLFSPGEFLKFKVDTTKIKAAMEELGEEIKGQCLEYSESNDTLSIATQMLEHMKCIVELLQSQDPHSVSESVLCMLQNIYMKSRDLRDETQKTLASFKVTYSMDVHVQAVSSFSVQLKMIYSANIRHSLGSGNTSEWHAATSLFITCAANLMSSVKDVLEASKSAQALPNNRPTSDTHPLPSAPRSQDEAIPQHRCPIRREYFSREVPTIRELCIAVTNHPTGKRFNLSDHISGSWKTIGLTLGMEFNVLTSIERNRYDDAERLMTVFKRWLENAAGLPHHARYPLSWQGLNTLLEDIGKMETAKQYFEFLELCNINS